MKIKKVLLSVFLIIAILGAGSLGFYYGKSQCKVCPPEDLDFSLFWQAFNVLEDKYVEKEKIDTQKIIYGAISGMLESLEDPYTVFFNPEDAKIFKEDIAGSFEGVGIEIGIRDGQLTVIAPLEQTPAQKAGIRSGDKIIKVNDVSTADITSDKAVKLIRGPEGTEVTLTVLRKKGEETEEIEFTLKREKIEIPALKWELKETPDGEKIAYLKIYQFSQNTTSAFQEAALEILDSPAQKIILDLRNNPGGYLEIARYVAGWFLERGDIVAFEESGREKTEIKARGNEAFLSYPMVVLINQGTASGAEILAAALRDNCGIKLIGETSFGKFSVQEPINLNGGSFLKVTIARWLTPNGEYLSEKGLEPDIIVEMSDEDFEAGSDPQLNKAVEEITKL
jgi:carboxyl-terminal processing protease